MHHILQHSIAFLFIPKLDDDRGITSNCDPTQPRTMKNQIEKLSESPYLGRLSYKMATKQPHTRDK